MADILIQKAHFKKKVNSQNVPLSPTAQYVVQHDPDEGSANKPSL